jgi:hypothetical protein
MQLRPDNHLEGVGTGINENIANQSERIFSPMRLQYPDAPHIILIGRN